MLQVGLFTPMVFSVSVYKQINEMFGGKSRWHSELPALVEIRFAVRTSHAIIRRTVIPRIGGPHG
jgi:hypothetical protein